MSPVIVRQLVASLLLWALASLGLAVLGLARPCTDRRRAFWLMTGLWGLVDGAIAWYALVRPPPEVGALATVLGLNIGLDILYLLAGALLARRSEPRLQGFGWAVIVQGLFLLGFDVVFFWICTNS
ncbi:MAG: hypothetical protein U0790_07085 [Isosphaeraceae bacterium]